MIEKIKIDDYHKNLNQDSPPDPEEYAANNHQENTLDHFNNNPTYFNNLFSDLPSEDPQPKEEKEEDKNQDTKRKILQKSEESGLFEENEQKIIYSLKDLRKNNIQFQNDIEISKEDNIVIDFKRENLTTIIHKNSNINIDKSFQQYKIPNIEIIKNKNYHLNEKLIITRNSRHKIISKKSLREKDKIKCKNRLKKIVKKYYIIHFIRFLKKYGNNLIKKSKMKKEFLNDKLKSPTKSLKLFLINENNSNILLFTVKNIFCYKKKNLKNNSQIKNEKFINNLFDSFIELPDKDKEKYEKIISFFDMNIQDACKLFEKSKEFKYYTTKPKIIIYNRDFEQKFGFNLIEKNEFIKMIKINGDGGYRKK